MSDRIVGTGKVRGVDASTGVMEFVMSTDKVARDGMIIRKEAWRSSIARAAKDERYLPKFTMAHLHAPLPDGSPPILGTVFDARWVEGEGLVAKVRWVDAKIQPAVDFWRRGYEKGFLTDVSVEWGQSQFADGASRQSEAPEIVDLTWDATSACVIGADGGAKKRAVEAGDADFVRQLEAEQARAAVATATRAVVPTPAAPAVVAPEPVIGARNIIKDYPGCPVGKPWALVAKGDGTILGCHASEADALAQEAVIATGVHAHEGKAGLRVSMTPVTPSGEVRIEGPVEVPLGSHITVTPALGVVGGTQVLTARQVADAVRAQPAPPARTSMARALTQYLGDQNLFVPFGPGALAPALAPGQAYRVVWYGIDVAFERVTPKTDDLFHFKGSAMERVLAEVDEFWDRAEDYAKLGVLHHRGVLLEGPPGCGKSSCLHLAAATMAARGDVVFLADSVGLMEHGLAAFRAVEPTRPVVVMIEDVDGWMGEERRLLALLDGDRAFDKVLFLATTNYPGSMSPRLLRAGRFDRKVHIGAPPIEGRLAYLTHKLGKIEAPEAIARLAAGTGGCSFGELRELIIAVYALKEPVADALARLAKSHASEDAARAAGGARGALADGASVIEVRLARLENEATDRAARHAALMAEVSAALVEIRAATAAPKTAEAAGTPPPVERATAAEAGAREGTSVFDGFLDGVGGEIRRAADAIGKQVAAASQ